MSIKLVSILALAVTTSFAAAACAANTDNGSSDPGATSDQDQDLSAAKMFGCAEDTDCEAVSSGGCCPTGMKTAVNKHHVAAFDASVKCVVHGEDKQACPLFLIDDTRVAACSAAGKCEMVKASKD